MADLAVRTAQPNVASMWDVDRRLPGGALAGDPPVKEGEELTFSDMLGALNPLQHIPVVSSIYRWITGDTLNPAARVVGGALFGGPIGMVSAALNAIIEQASGKDIGEQVIALFEPGDDATAGPQLAATEIAPTESRDEAASRDGTPHPTTTSPPMDAAKINSAATKAVPESPRNGRDLAFYLAHAGQRLPPVETSRDGRTQGAVEPRRAAAPVFTPARFAATDTGDKGTPSVSSSDNGPPSTWFAATMLHGLDRYRAMQQRPAAASTVDRTE